MALELSLQGHGPVSGCIVETVVSESATWLWACILKIALGLHRVSEFPTWIPKLPEKHSCLWIDASLLLLSGGGGGYEQGTSCATILLMSFSQPWFLRVSTGKP